jgi:GxxExxY protein
MTEFETPDHAVITASIEVHRHLGPGLLESAFSQCLTYELAERGVPFLVDPFVSIKYKKLGIERAFRADLIVADMLIVEIKHIEKILAIHEAQLRTYVKLTGIKTGLLLNFSTTVLKNGIRRLDLP